MTWTPTSSSSPSYTNQSESDIVTDTSGLDFDITLGIINDVNLPSLFLMDHTNNGSQVAINPLPFLQAGNVATYTTTLTYKIGTDDNLWEQGTLIVPAGGTATTAEWLSTEFTVKNFNQYIGTLDVNVFSGTFSVFQNNTGAPKLPAGIPIRIIGRRAPMILEGYSETGTVDAGGNGTISHAMGEYPVWNDVTLTLTSGVRSGRVITPNLNTADGAFAPDSILTGSFGLRSGNISVTVVGPEDLTGDSYRVDFSRWVERTPWNATS